MKNNRFTTKEQIDIPFLDLKPQHVKLKKQILAAWENILTNAAFVGGDWISDFETKFASFCGVEHTAAVDSGTDALEVALRAFGAKKGDEIIAPANTFYATIEAILLVGATPILVDCEKESWNIDVDQIEKNITSNTIGIIGVHLYGNPCDMDEINVIAKKHSLWVLEDSAQAHGALYKNKKCGSLGDAAAFSFYPGKNLGSTGEGGAITSTNPTFIERCKIIRNHGCKIKYVHEILGKNSKMPTLMASALTIKLDYIDEWNNKRRENASYYIESLSGIEEIQLPNLPAGNNPVWHLFVIHDKINKRDKLHDFLKQNGIGTGFHYPVPVHLQNHFKGIYAKKDFPNAEFNSDNCLSLPMYPEITKEQINIICSKVKDFYRSNGKK